MRISDWSSDVCSSDLAGAADPFMRPFALYGASKAALDRFAAGTAPDLAATGIAVTTITPGAFVETPGAAAIDLRDAADLGRIDVDRAGAAGARSVERRGGKECVRQRRSRWSVALSNKSQHINF